MGKGILIPAAMKCSSHTIEWPFNLDYPLGIWVEITFDAHMQLYRYLLQKKRGMGIFGSMSTLVRWIDNQPPRMAALPIFFYKKERDGVFVSTVAHNDRYRWQKMDSPIVNRWHRFTVQFADDVVAARWMGREYVRMMETFI